MLYIQINKISCPGRLANYVESIGNRDGGEKNTNKKTVKIAACLLTLKIKI